MKTKIQFVDGTLLMLKNSDRLYQAWRCCNTLVLAWIRNSVSVSIGYSIMFMDKAKEVWDDLTMIFA